MPSRIAAALLLGIMACSDTSNPVAPTLPSTEISVTSTAITTTTTTTSESTTTVLSVEDPFIDLIVSSLPWDHEQWMIGWPDVEMGNGFVTVYREAIPMFDVQFLGDCRRSADDREPPDEAEIVAIWEQQSEDHRGDFEVDNFDFQLATASVQGNEVQTSLWTHTTERGLTQAEVRAYVDGGERWCLLTAPAVHPENLEAVRDFYPVLVAFLDEAGQPNMFDPEPLLEEIEHVRASAGPGHLVGFVQLTGEASTSPPEPPLENPICRGTADGLTEHLTPGRPVEIFGRRDELLATTVLRGSMFDTHLGCGMWFAVDVPERDWYAIRVGLHSGVDFDAALVDRGGWIVYLWSDESSLEANCGDETGFQACAVMGFGG